MFQPIWGKMNYTNRILFVIGACAGTYVTVYVAMFLSRCRGKIWQILCKILCFLGKNSIDIVIWQFVSFRLCVLLQLYLEGRPLRDVLTCDSRYYTDHGLVAAVSGYWNHCSSGLGMVSETWGLGERR